MMTVWMIWVRGGDGFTWLSDAWDEDTISDNGPGWRAALDKGQADAQMNEGTMRLQMVRVPSVDELFAVSTVTAEVAQ